MVGLLVLLTTILPAEFGSDPLGTGRLLGQLLYRRKGIRSKNGWKCIVPTMWSSNWDPSNQWNTSTL